MPKRMSHTADFKLQVIKFAKENGNRAAGREFKVGETSVREWRKQGDELEKMNPRKRARRGGKAKWPNLEAKLVRWISGQQENNYAVSTIAIKAKARILAHKMKINNFNNGSYNWVYNFLRRNNLSLPLYTSDPHRLPDDWEKALDDFSTFVREEMQQFELTANDVINVNGDMINLSSVDKPIVFKNKISNWKASSWTPKYLEKIFGNKILNFRVGSQKSQFESECEYICGTMKNFNDWCNGVPNVNSEFSRYLNSDHWCYFDYKHMAELFEDQSRILDSVNWSDFGYSGRNGNESTIWVGSTGATTACHQDSYGFNLVSQIFGRKRWILFSPDDTQYMYATRIPYEESSIYSRVNISKPNLNAFPLFQNARPFVVTLEPGDVLLVPHKWWHYVYSLDTTISINTWIEIPTDDLSRLKESIVRTLLLPLMTQYYNCPIENNSINSWLNPNEINTSIRENFKLLQNALTVCRKSKKKRKNYDFNIESPICKLQACSSSCRNRDSEELCANNFRYINMFTESEGNTVERINTNNKINSSGKSIDGDNENELTNDSKLKTLNEIKEEIRNNYEENELLLDNDSKNAYQVNHIIGVDQINFEEYLKIVKKTTEPSSQSSIDHNFKLREFDFNDFVDMVMDEDVVELISKKILI